MTGALQAQAPTADFSATPLAGDAPLQVTFTDASTGSVTAWSWDFGDTGSATNQNPTHTYTAVGTYTISLTATGPGGSDVETKVGYVQVTEPAPAAEFVATPLQGDWPLLVTFTDQTAGSVTAWQWTFGDGATSTLQSPTHTYGAGTYTVSLTATGPGGSDVETKTDYIQVTEPAPAAEFVGTPLQGDWPLLVTFTDQTAGSVTAWQWTFGDGATSTLQSPTHTYGAAGTYTVSLTATGPGGSDVETKTDYIQVSEPAPVAQFVGTPLQGDWPLPVTFTDQTTGSVSGWQWTFGDGAGSTLQSPTHTYAAEGTYTVSLVATGPGGSTTETKADYITVTTARPQVDFVATPLEGSVPLTVSFSNQTTGQVTSWLWNFGDGSGSTLQDPSYEYQNKGTYTITLQATGPGGMDTLVKSDYIVVRRPPPIDGPHTPTGNVARTLTYPSIGAEPTLVDFGAVGSGASAQLTFVVFNDGWDDIELTHLDFFDSPFGTAEAFTLDFNGQQYVGTDADQTFALTPLIIAPDDEPIVATVTFAPTEERFDSFRIKFRANWQDKKRSAVEVQVDGLGGHEGDPFLHVVIDAEDWVVDYDEDGTETVTFDGSGSHTHEPGRAISLLEWEIDGSVVHTGSALTTTLPLGTETVLLRIYDDDVPPKTLTDTVDLEVVTTANIPGTLVSYYDGQESGATLLLDNVPVEANFRERRSSYNVDVAGGTAGSSPFNQDVMVQIEGDLTIDQAGSYEFTTSGGVDSRLELDGVPVVGPQALSVGTYALEARFAVDFLVDLPVDVLVALDGGSADPIDPSVIRHDESTMPPLIHSVTPDIGTTAGGNTIVIDGFGFFPYDEVILHWGNDTYTQQDFAQLTSTQITFVTPAGVGLIAVSVETGEGTTAARPFTYQLDGPVPIDFQLTDTYPLTFPTNAAWGPDGRLYVARLSGHIVALEFDDSYDLVSSTTYTGVSNLTNPDTIGITFNPYDPPSPVRVYLGHGEHYANGGTTPTEHSPYSGQVSYLDGPDFDTPVPLITGLPVSNHDHAVNQMAFDNNGDLLIAVGSMTNAGVPHNEHGGLPESPLSAAILKAHTSRPGFNGTITYSETVGGQSNDDQRFGDIVDVDPGVDVEPWAFGLRNAFGLVYTTKSRLYCTDNGPNSSYGPSSTGPTTQGPPAYDDDEINLIEWNNYYGSPNRNRGRYDARQNIYYGGLSGPASTPEWFTQYVEWLPPSTDGIDEYRADTFQGQIRGNLIVQEYLNKMRRLTLTEDGRTLTGQPSIDPNTQGLSCVTSPGGVIISLDHDYSEIEIFQPNDASAMGLVVHDIFPWRGPASGGTPFVISGVGFGNLGNTSVTIGGNTAVISAVSPTRIHGTVPAESAPTTDLVDVVVTVSGIPDTLTQAYRYLFGPGLEPGRWESLDPVPTALGEVAGGVIDGILYLVGEGSPNTYAYDCLNRQWISNAAPRLQQGHHHAAEVHDGKLYLIGGLSGNSEGKVQIYDPMSDSWSNGADMDWAAGSLNTALIDGKIYAAGGIVNSSYTVINAGVYDPVLDTWSDIEFMPDGRNHAAAGTDGEKFYIFGGRKGGNFVANGFDETFIYDPGTDTWDWSGAMESVLTPLPEARGGMGKAIYLRGEFYVFGGETLNDPDANPGTNVYDRVDVYDVATNSWRLERAMPSARHGIFPFLFQGLVFLPAGGTNAGFSQSTVFDTFTRQ